MAIFPDGATRGEQPRYNCGARRPDRIANSNVLMSSGRLISDDPGFALDVRLVQSGQATERGMLGPAFLNPPAVLRAA
jgi:hypothetical protein